MNVIVHGRFSGPAGLSLGSPRILSGSITAALPNTEMCYKTRRQKPSQKSGLPMFGDHFTQPRNKSRVAEPWIESNRINQPRPIRVGPVDRTSLPEIRGARHAGDHFLEYNFANSV